MEYQLDEEELLHAAITAGRDGMHDRAIGLLKQLVDREPQHAGAFHMLGAEYAEIGMIDRAIATISHALELNPSLHTARFQLGLLHALTGDSQAARTAWTSLSTLGDSPLNRYREALELLLDNKVEEAREGLLHALSADNQPGALETDMRRLADSLSTDMGDSEEQPPQAGAGASRFLLARYGTEDSA